MNTQLRDESMTADEAAQSAERLWHMRHGLGMAFVLAFAALVFGLTFHKTAHDIYLDAGVGRVVVEHGLAAASQLSAQDGQVARTGWLWQVIAFGLVEMGGVWAVSIVASVLTAAGFTVALATLGRRLNVVAAGFALIGAAYLGRAAFAPGGQAVGIFLFGALFALLWNTYNSSGRRIWLAAPLMLFWVNADISWPAGAALCAAFLAVTAMSKTPRRGEKCLALMAALAATLANPDFAGAYGALWKLPFGAKSPMAWVAPSAAAVGGAARAALYALALTGAATAILSRDSRATAAAAAAVLLAVAGVPASLLPIAALAGATAIAAGLPGALETIGRLTRSDVFAEWVLPVVTTQEDAQAAGGGQPTSVAERRAYGLGALVAGAGLAAVLVMFSISAAASAEYSLGGGTLMDEQLPAKAIVFARANALKGEALVPPLWAGYFVYRYYPEAKPLYDPRPLGVTEKSANIQAEVFARRPRVAPAAMVNRLLDDGMDFALVQDGWAAAAGMPKFLSAVYWDDHSAVMMANLPENAEFIRAHDDRLTYPGYFARALTPERLPEIRKALERKLADDPDSALAHYEMAMTYFVSKDYSRTVEHLIVALANRPTLAHAYHVLGDIVRTTKSEEIAQALVGAFMRAPTMERLYLALSRAQGERKYEHMAAAFYGEAIWNDPLMAMPYIQLSNILLEEGHAIQGLAMLEKAQEADKARPQLDGIRPGLRAELGKQIETVRGAFTRPAGAGAVGSTAPAAGGEQAQAPEIGSSGTVAGGVTGHNP